MTDVSFTPWARSRHLSLRKRWVRNCVVMAISRSTMSLLWQRLSPASWLSLIIANMPPISRRPGQGLSSFYRSLRHTLPQSAVLLVHQQPYKAYARLAQMFYPILPTEAGDISPHAMIDPSATIGADCTIDAGAVVGANAKLGDRVRIGSNSVVGPAVEIGTQTSIGTGVSLSNCLIGQRVRILPGVRIGQEGFGFAIDPTGHIRIPQLGRVIVEDDVEIGANSTVDRGAGPDTIIGRGAMIDNLVQIGHNVTIGPGCIIVAQAGIAGSTHIEAGVAIGGQVGVAGHLRIGRGAQIAGQSGVMRNVDAEARMMGYPAVTTREFFRQITWLKRAMGSNSDTQEQGSG